MLTILAAAAVLLAIFVAAALATKEGGELLDAPPDDPDLALPGGMLVAEDVARVRFSVTVRGYKMSEVDQVLERVAGELADRDERIALLTAAVEAPVAEEPRPSEPPALLEPPGPVEPPAPTTPLLSSPAPEPAGPIDSQPATTDEPVVPDSAPPEQVALIREEIAPLPALHDVGDDDAEPTAEEPRGSV